MGIDALTLYVKSNLAPKNHAKLQALKTPAPVQAPIPPSREGFLHQQAVFKAAIREEEKSVSDTSVVKSELATEKPKPKNDIAEQHTTSAAAEAKPKQTSTAEVQVPAKRPLVDGTEAPAPKHPKKLPPTPIQERNIQPTAKVPPSAPAQERNIQPVTRGVATLVTLGLKPCNPQHADSSKSSIIIETLLDVFPEGLTRITSFTNQIATSSGQHWKYCWFCVTCIGTGISFRDIKDASSPELYACEEHPGIGWTGGNGPYIRFVGSQSGRAQFDYAVLV